MARRQNTRFTIYDAMEARGVFDDNPANSQADGTRDGVPFSTWPNRFPMMLYHPQGAERIARQAEMIMTVMGPKAVNELKELISAIAQNASEEAALLAAGWHHKPADAVKARLGTLSIAANPAQTIEALQGELKRLQAQLNDATARALAASPQATSTVMNTAQALKESAKTDLSEEDAEEKVA